MVKTLCFHYVGFWFEPWPGNQDLACCEAKKKRKKETSPCEDCEKIILKQQSEYLKLIQYCKSTIKIFSPIKFKKKKHCIWFYIHRPFVSIFN